MYYWEYFKNHTKRDENNPGYKVKDWWIPTKYASLKQELESNTDCLSAAEFAIVIDKAEVIAPSLRSRSIRNRDYWFTRGYGIADGAGMSVEHIAAVSVYCNFYVSCVSDFNLFVLHFAFLLRSTFRARSIGLFTV